MPEDPKKKEARMAERQRVEDFYRKRRIAADERALAEKKKPKKPLTEAQKKQAQIAARNEAAKGRRDTGIEQAAPSGYQRLLRALGWGKKPQPKK
jgi:hypothetical protein